MISLLETFPAVKQDRELNVLSITLVVNCVHSVNEDRITKNISSSTTRQCADGANLSLSGQHYALCKGSFHCPEIFRAVKQDRVPIALDIHDAFRSIHAGKHESFHKNILRSKAGLNTNCPSYNREDHQYAIS